MKINQIQSDLKKKHGDHFVTSASDTLDVERIPTGIFHIDRATGGGLPRGKSSNIWGEESTGKTNIAIKTMAMHQKLWPEGVEARVREEQIKKELLEEPGHHENDMRLTEDDII